MPGRTERDLFAPRADRIAAAYRTHGLKIAVSETMIHDDLTSDNIHLSRTKTPQTVALSEGANSGKAPLDEHVARS
jgi:hypothetical protein